MRTQRVINNQKSRRSINSLSVRISSAGYVKADDGWRQSPLYAGFSRLYFVIDGEGYLLSDKEKMRLEPGYVYLSPCGDKCGFYTDTTVTKLFFHVNMKISEDGTDAFENYGRLAKLEYSIDKMKRLTEAYLGEDIVGHAWAKAEIFSTVAAFLSENPTCILEPQKSSQVLEAIKYIRTHLTAALTVSEVARAVLSSESRLATIFKREVGNSIAWYIEDLVMSEAQNMLMGGKMTISEISDSLGFCDQFYFSRRFKKRFGLSPREYVKKSEG